MEQQEGNEKKESIRKSEEKKRFYRKWRGKGTTRITEDSGEIKEKPGKELEMNLKMKHTQVLITCVWKECLRILNI